MNKLRDRQPVAAPLPSEVQALPGQWAWVCICALFLLLPAVGAPVETLLQDTLKSALVAVFTALAWVAAFGSARSGNGFELRWHPALWGAVLLTLYACGSMVWSHPYLGGVEAVRWLVLAALSGLVMNLARSGGTERLLWAVHLGAVVASGWAAAQFWVDLDWFPQGRAPASTFVNRNFLAEYLVCAMPLTVWLLLRQTRWERAAAIGLGLALQVVAVWMTGTRSAIVALGVLALVSPLLMFATGMPWPGRSWRPRLAWLGLLVLTVATLSSWPTGNAQIIREHAQDQRGLTGWQRGISRTSSLTHAQEYTEGSFSVRIQMWQSTLRMIEAHPWTGVGAGAWEVQAPLFQAEGSQVEADYYAHNEFLQLLAEYGLVGWLVLLAWMGWLARLAGLTWRRRATMSSDELMLRCWCLSSLAMLFIVSMAGFPWRLAGTGALLALTMGWLMASELRERPVSGLKLERSGSSWGLCLSIVGLLLAVFVSERAFRCENRLISAIQLALAVTESGEPNAPRWAETRIEILKRVKEGIDIHPHYRKLTPQVADELLKWGDWSNAIWMLDSVAESRPNVVVLLTNVARAYVQLQRWSIAAEYMERARRIQPQAKALQALDLLQMEHRGQTDLALRQIRRYLEADESDYDTATTSFGIASRLNDIDLAVAAIRLRNRHHPEHAADGWLRVGRLLATAQPPRSEQALEAFRQMLQSAPPAQRDRWLQVVPQPYRSSLGAAGS